MYPRWPLLFARGGPDASSQASTRGNPSFASLQGQRQHQRPRRRPQGSRRLAAAVSGLPCRVRRRMYHVVGTAGARRGAQQDACILYAHVKTA